MKKLFVLLIFMFSVGFVSVQATSDSGDDCAVCAATNIPHKARGYGTHHNTCVTPDRCKCCTRGSGDGDGVGPHNPS